jgi:hypothetical protein
LVLYPIGETLQREDKQKIAVISEIPFAGNHVNLVQQDNSVWVQRCDSNSGLNEFRLLYSPQLDTAQYRTRGFLYMESGIPPKRGNLVYQLIENWYLVVGKEK